ncbi:MAG: LAGLIDADG family homing endonuclease [Anaerolineales bacterium]
MSALDEFLGRLKAMPAAQSKEIVEQANKYTKDMLWCPNVVREGGEAAGEVAPQILAEESEADELLYGGEAGGGKTDLLIGSALNRHRSSLLLRRLNAEVEGLADRIEEILTERGFTTPRKLYNSSLHTWKIRGRVIKLGGCQFLADRKKYQGRPRDLIAFDELANFLEAQYRFIIAWNRSTIPGQRVRVIAATNPPVTPEGLWIVKYWGAWLDPNHPSPAAPGELRWYTTIDDLDVEVDGPGPVQVDGVPLLDKAGHPIFPKSRTYIPAELVDNPDLVETGYGARLHALPGPLKAAMAEGDFSRGLVDDEWQVVPSDWIEQAMARWHEDGGARTPMTAIGVDIAQGGCFDDQTEILTDRGWLPFETIMGTEKVLTLNGMTAEWGSITQLHRYWHDGPMNLLDRPDLSFCITDNHQLLAKYPRGKWAIRRYDALPGAFVMPRATEWVGGNPENIEFESRYEMPNGGIRLKRWPFSFEDWARFLGWFIAEGCAFRENRKGGRWRINIAQKKGPKLERIAALLKRMGIIARRPASRSGMEFSINHIGEHLALTCGIHAANKRVPAYIKNASPCIIRAFLEEYRLGDGSVNSKGVASYVTTSKGLADDLQEVLAKLGRAGKMAVRQEAGSRFLIGNRSVVRKHRVYVVTERSAGSDCYILKLQVQRVRYRGFVYCVSTPLKTILVRRKGTVMWSGNSDQTVLAPRHGGWFARLQVFKGIDTPDGPSVAGLIFMTMRNGCEVILDVGGGYGGSTRDHLKQAFSPTLFNGAEAGMGRDRTGMIKFANRRAEAWFRLRDALDPNYGSNLALPPDTELKAELAAPRWKNTLSGALLEAKESIKSRISRSTDRADAVVMAWFARGKTNLVRNVIPGLQTKAIVSARRPPRWGRSGG